MAELTYNEIQSEFQDQNVYCDNCHHQARNHEIDYEGNDTNCWHCDPKTGKSDCDCRCFDDYDNWKPKNKKEADNWNEDIWFMKHAKITRELKTSFKDSKFIDVRATYGNCTKSFFVFDTDPNFEKELKKCK